MKFNVKNLLGAGTHAAQQASVPQTLGKKIGEGIKGAPVAYGNKLGGAAKWMYSAPSNFAAGLEQGILGTSGTFTKTAGLIGTAGYLGNLAAKKFTGTSLGEMISGEPVVAPETSKWRKKTETDIMGSLTPKGYDANAFDLSHNQSDEGWRAGIKAFKKEDFNKMAKDAVTSGDVEGLYNAVVKKSLAAGKKVNSSKPLYIPALFSKEGKKFGYAIVKGEDGATPKLVKIELGKGVSFDE